MAIAMDPSMCLAMSYGDQMERRTLPIRWDLGNRLTVLSERDIHSHTADHAQAPLFHISRFKHGKTKTLPNVCLCVHLCCRSHLSSRMHVPTIYT